jgi:dTMP kinase
VLSDRFLDSSIAYQGGAGGLGFSHVRTLHELGSEGLVPDRTLVLTLGGEQGTQRALARDGHSSDRIGGRSSDYHRNVQEAFGRIAQEEPERVRLIDASGEPGAVTVRLLHALQDLLP